MVLEDKDFIMRQVKQLAEGMGKFLSLESIKELIMISQKKLFYRMMKLRRSFW